MNELKDRRCAPIAKGSPALDTAAVSALLIRLNGEWKCSDDAKSIRRDFKFKNFYHTIAFVNAVAWIANQEDHHPDLNVSYSHCGVTFTTHSANGLTENDFICAAKIDNLVNNRPGVTTP